ncbi:MAG: hypothetical protein U0836_04525 [Pirellulales bacterium]
MKLPSLLLAIRQKNAAIRKQTIHGPIAPQSVFAGHCEQICMRIQDAALRERCLRACGY